MAYDLDCRTKCICRSTEIHISTQTARHISIDLSCNAADLRTGGGGREEVDGLAGDLDVVLAGVGQPDLEPDLGEHQHGHRRRAPAAPQFLAVEEDRRAEAARARRRL